MAYIFMDESGDLGFDKSKARCSKNFLITFFFCDNPNPFEKIVKKTFLSMPPDKQIPIFCWIGLLIRNYVIPKSRYILLHHKKIQTNI